MSRLNFFGNGSKAQAIDVDRYLQRIKVHRENPSVKYLRELHKAHLMYIPFENLDIHYVNRIVLDYEAIFHKIIGRGRGGFCYELNGLFYHLLYHLGFECYLISAKTKQKEDYSKDFDHMAIVVSLDKVDWLVDVGFGDHFIYPKKIETGTVQMDYLDYWRFSTDPDENLILQQSDNYSTFYSKYQFTLQEKQPIQFMERCEFHQSSRDSPFVHQKLITRLTPDGRITLTDRTLKINSLGEASETEILNEDEFLSKLQHHFNIGFKQLLPK